MNGIDPITRQLEFQSAIEAGDLFAEILMWVMLVLVVVAFFDRKRLARNAAAKLEQQKELEVSRSLHR